MFQILKRNPTAGVFAVLMHIAIIAFLIVGVDWLEKPKQPKSNVEVVQARVIDASRVAAEVEKLKQADIKRKEERASVRRQEEERLAELKRQQQAEQERIASLEQKRVAAEKKRKAEEQKRAAAEQQRKAEEQRLREAEVKRKAEEQKRLAAEKKRKAEEQKKREAEAKRIAAEKKRKAEEQKKREAEARRKAEEKERKEAEARRQAELEKKRRAEAARKAREAEMQAAIEAENNAREIDRYMIQIRQRVDRSWVRPAGIGEGLKCRLRVRLAPGGTVIAVSVLESSGNGAFDRAATSAVYKAEPLPVPAGALFESFRDINFVFDPNK